MNSVGQYLWSTPSTHKGFNAGDKWRLRQLGRKLISWTNQIHRDKKPGIVCIGSWVNSYWHLYDTWLTAGVQCNHGELDFLSSILFFFFFFTSNPLVLSPFLYILPSWRTDTRTKLNCAHFLIQVQGNYVILAQYAAWSKWRVCFSVVSWWPIKSRPLGITILQFPNPRHSKERLVWYVSSPTEIRVLLHYYVGISWMNWDK